jgi:hypothetical protein
VASDSVEERSVLLAEKLERIDGPAIDLAPLILEALHAERAIALEEAAKVCASRADRWRNDGLQPVMSTEDALTMIEKKLFDLRRDGTVAELALESAREKLEAVRRWAAAAGINISVVLGYRPDALSPESTGGDPHNPR